jgi:hypothetical protein
LGNHSHHQIALPAALGGEDGRQAQLADEAQDSLDVAVGNGSLGGEQFLGGDQGFVAQQSAQGFDLLRRPMGEIGQGALNGFLALAPTLAQEDGGRGVAIGDSFDVHGTDYAYLSHQVNRQICIYMGTFCHASPPVMHL